MPTNCKVPPYYMRHAVTFLSFVGENILSTQDNLFEVLQRFDRRFVVDSHINWFQLSVAQENLKTAFVIGTTASKEASPLRFVLETPGLVPKVRQNVFMFGGKDPTPEDIEPGITIPRLLLARLDEHAPTAINMAGVRQFEEKEKRTWDTSESIAEEKAKVLALLGVSRVEEVGTVVWSPKDAELRTGIERDRGTCFSDFWKSNDVSLRAYARLLLVSRRARNEFAEADNPNVFGDADLVQDALFLNAGILSKDRAVQKMARFCGVLCGEVPQEV